MGFKVKGRRISHKPNETWRYSQNLVGGREEKPTERKRERESNSKRKEKSKNYYADLVDFFYHSISTRFFHSSTALFKYLDDDDDDNLSHSTLRKKSSQLFMISMFLFIFV